MDKLLAINIPGYTGNPINAQTAGLNPKFTTLGSFLTEFYPVVLYISAFLMISWMAWGVFEYIFAGGNKESLGKARSRITWAIVGFLIVVIAFSVGEYAKKIFPQVEEFEKNRPATTITP